MTTIKNINTHADYNEAVAKLESYRAALAVEQQLFNELDAARVATAKPAEQDAIDMADRILSGTPMQESLGPCIAANARKIAALRRAIEQQQREVTRIRGEHSIRVCRGLVPEHIALVERVLQAVEALHTANKAERELRDAIEVAGYSSSLLPPMGFAPRGEDIFNVRDECWGYAPSWARDAGEYIARRALPFDTPPAAVTAPFKAPKPTARVAYRGEGEILS